MAMQSAYSSSEIGQTRHNKASVSDPKSSSRPMRPASKDLPAGQAESVLKLEDTSEGSTDAVGGNGAAQSPQDQNSTIKPLSTSNEAVVSESSTGGFETMLGTLVVENGLVTP